MGFMTMELKEVGEVLQRNRMGLEGLERIGMD